MRYLLLDYRDSLNKNLYEDVDQVLLSKDKLLFLAEKKHLIKNEFKIIESLDNYGTIIIVDKNVEIPYLKIDFTIWKCGKNGLICECCNDYCIEYKTCKDSYYHIEQLKKEYEKELIEAKKKYIESLPEDNIIKLLFYSN